MRGVKAEGGWAVVCTEEVEIHPTSEVAPYAEGRLWDDEDIPALARMVEQVHEHGSLAGIELLPQRSRQREPLQPHARRWRSGTCRTSGYDPVQARRMGLEDIDDLRRYHRAAVAPVARGAGFDLVYVYAGARPEHDRPVPLPRAATAAPTATAARSANRARLLREVLEDTLEEVDGRAAVACRITVDELAGRRRLRARRDRGGARARRRAPRSVGLRRRRLGGRLRHVPLRRGGRRRSATCAASSS